MDNSLKVKVEIDSSPLKALADSLAGMQDKLGAAAAKSAQAAKKASADVKAATEKSAQDQAAAFEKAQSLMNAAAEKAAKIREKYAGEEVSGLVADYKKLQDSNAQIKSAMTATDDKEAKKALAIQKAKNDDELRLMKAVAMTKHAILHEGAGAEIGIMGVGRDLTRIGKEAHDTLGHLGKDVAKDIFGELTKGLGPLEGIVKTAFGKMSGEAHAAGHAVKAEEHATTEAIQHEATAQVHAKEEALHKELAAVKQEAAQERAAHAGGGGGGAAHAAEGGGGGGIGGMLGSIGGSAAGMIGAAGGVAAVGAALSGLIEKGKEAAERAEELKIGLMSAGMSGEEAEKKLSLIKKTSTEVAHEFAIGKADIDNATAAYLKMGGTADNLKEKQEDIAALSKKAGVDMEQAAKMYARAGDPEVSANLKKYGINLQGVTDQAERSRIIHQKLAGTVDALKEAAEGPLGGFNRMKLSIGELTGALGSLLFDSLGPVFQMLGEIGHIIQESIVPIFKTLASSVLSPVKIVFEAITGAIKEVFEALKPAMDQVSGLNKTLTDSLMPILKQVIEVGMVPLRTALNLLVGVIKIFIGIIKFVANAVIEYVETLIKVYEWIGKVTGITAFLKEAWEAITNTVSNAIKWFNEAKETVSKLGSSILETLGVKEKDAEATKHETESLKENTQAAEDNYAANEKLSAGRKQGIDDIKKHADKLLDDYDRQKEYIRTGMAEGQKLTEEQIQHYKDSNERLLTAIKKNDADVAAYNKNFAESEKEAGRGKTEDKKQVHLTELQDLRKRLKEEEDTLLAAQSKEEARVKKEMAENPKRKKELEIVLLEITSDYAQKNSDLYAKYEKKAGEITYKGKEDKLSTIAEFNLKSVQMATKSLEDQGAIDEQEIALAQERANKVLAIQDEIEKLTASTEVKGFQKQRDEEEARFKAVWDLRKKDREDKEYGEEFSKALDAEHLKRLKDIEKAETDFHIKIASTIKRLQIEGIKDENDRAEAQENERYREQLIALKTELADAENGAKLREELEKEHQRKLMEIKKKEIQFILGPLNNAFAKAGDEFNAKFTKPMLEGIVKQKTMFGSLVQEIVAGMVKMFAEKAAKRAADIVTEGIFGEVEKKQAVEKNTEIAASAAPAAAAEAVATGGTSAALGVASVLASIATIVGAIMGYAKPHAEGAIFTAPAFTRYGGDIHSTAERGPELALPLSKLPSMVGTLTAGGMDQHTSRLEAAIGRMTAVAGRQQTITQDGYNIKTSINRDSAIVNRRKIQ